MDRDRILIKGYLAGYMHKQANQQAMPDPNSLPGSGMGPGIPGVTQGFAMNSQQAMDQQQVAGEDPNAAAEAQAKQQELDKLEKEREDLAFQAQQQQQTSNIMKEKLKIQKSRQEMENTMSEMANAGVEAQNNASLSTMLNTSSPGETV